MIERQGFGDFAADGKRPGVSAQAACVSGRIGFIEAEFIKVVVAGDFIFRGEGELTLPCCGFIKGQRLSGRRRRAIVAFKPIEQVGMGLR